MKTFILTTVFLLLSFSTSFGQANSASACVNLTATPAVLPFGEIVVITASSPNDHSTAYQWKISDGEIIKGQNTNSISIRAYSPGKLTATVEVKNGNTFCLNSIFVDVLGCGLISEYDRFGKLPLNAERARLDNVAAGFTNFETDAQILIFANFGKRITEAHAAFRLARIKNYLSKQRKIDSSKILTFITEDDYLGIEGETIVIFIMPKDAPNPLENYKLLTDERIAELTKKISQSNRKKN